MTRPMIRDPRTLIRLYDESSLDIFYGTKTTYREAAEIIMAERGTKEAVDFLRACLSTQ